jgi:hypothetical protein
MRQTASHHPRSGALHIEELRQLFPPELVFLPKYSEPLAAMFRVAFHEPDAGFLFRKRRGIDFDAQHVAKPQVLAHALMHHLFVHAASARIAVLRPYWKLLILELAPYADHLDALGFVSFDQKIVLHNYASLAGEQWQEAND